MDLVQQANTRLDEARTNLAVVAADYEARLSSLAEDASAEDIQAVLDEFDPQLDAAKDSVQRTQAQLDQVTRVMEARVASADLIPGGTETTSTEVADGAEGRTVRGGIQVLSEPLTYMDPRVNSQAHSYFADLYKANFRQDQTAIARLARGTQETLVESEARGRPYHDLEGRAMSSTTGAGGDFLPPLYFGDLYAEFKRASRVTSRLVRNLPLAAQGNTITIPRVTGGTATAAQQDNQNVQTTDATTAILTVPVCTVAGYNDLSRQIVERSEPGLDLIILEDLLRDYNKRVNAYVVNGTGSSGQPTGLLQQSGTNAVTFTSGSPTVGLLYPKVLSSVAQITEAVFEPTASFVMTALRWAWILSSLDSNGRPLAVPNGQGPFNALGLMNDGNKSFLDNVVPAGWFAGYPVYVDETIPKNTGSGTNQDSIIGAAWNEHILWEDPAGPRNFQFEGVTSQTAAIRIQVFGYMAFTAGRYPAATSVIAGTGLAQPTL